MKRAPPCARRLWREKVHFRRPVRLLGVGVTHLITKPWFFYGGTEDSLPDKREALRHFARDVIARL